MTVTLAHVRLSRPLAVVDLESTGVDPAADRVVEVGVLTLLPGGGQELYHRRVNPGVPIPAAATAVHGIADADVAAAPPFAAVAPELFATLFGCDLAGFGIATFDLPLLSAEFARAGLPFRVAGRRVVDVLALCPSEDGVPRPRRATCDACGRCWRPVPVSGRVPLPVVDPAGRA